MTADECSFLGGSLPKMWTASFLPFSPSHTLPRINQLYELKKDTEPACAKLHGLVLFSGKEAK